MNLYLGCLIVVVSVGASVVWSNPRNLLSQTIALVAFAAALWIGMLWAIRAPWTGNPVPWLRAAVAIGDFFPALIWWMGRCAINPRGTWRDFFVEGRYWLGAGALLAALALSRWFLPPEASPARHVYGIGYVPHQIAQILVFVVLLGYAAKELAVRRGFERAMAKVFFIGGGLTALLSAGMMLAKHLGLPGLVRGAPLVGCLFFVLGAWAVSSQQLLDQRHHLLNVVRRSVGLIVTAFSITWLLEQTWTMPREFQVLIAASSGVALALGLDLLSSFILERSFGRNSLQAAAALQKFTTEVAAMPAGELRGTAASDLANILSSPEAAIYWRNDSNGALQLISYHPRPRVIPATVEAGHPLIVHSGRERVPWWIGRHLQSLETGLTGIALCVPVIERDHVLLLVLIGHKQSVMGFSQVELSALQAWALACHHTLTTRALIERENAQQQLVYAGKLAAGIAHNLRNPLAVVRAYLEADPTLPPTQLDELRALAVAEIARVQSTVDGLTALSRGERFTLAPHPPKSLVERAIELNRSYLTECGASIELHASSAALSVLAEPWQFTTAMTNLLRNSAEEVAREGGGWIRVELSARGEKCVEIRVRDSGRGLPTHIREAVFSRDLFAQTTKSTSATSRRTGFGVGLHSTMLIVTIGHGGQFDYRDGAFIITLAAPSFVPQLHAGKNNSNTDPLLDWRHETGTEKRADR